MVKSPYEALGLPEGCSSPVQIKQAYRTLARQYHPDKNPSASAASRCAEINKAYEILSDPEALEEYQRTSVRFEDVLSSFAKACGPRSAPSTSSWQSTEDADMKAEREDLARRCREVEAQKERRLQEEQEAVRQQEILRQQEAMRMEAARQEELRRMQQQAQAAEQERQRQEHLRAAREAEVEERRKAQYSWPNPFRSKPSNSNSGQHTQKDHRSYFQRRAEQSAKEEHEWKFNRLEENVRSVTDTVQALREQICQLQGAADQAEDTLRQLETELNQLRPRSAPVHEVSYAHSQQLPASNANWYN